MAETPSRRSWVAPFLVAVVLAAFVAMRGFAGGAPQAPKTVPYSELYSDVNDGKIESVEIQQDELVAHRKGEGGKPGDVIIADRLPNVEDAALLSAMREHGVKLTGRTEHASTWSTLLWSVLPFLVLPVLFWLGSGALLARGGGGTAKPMSFGKSKAKLHDRSAENNVTFDDVAGVEEAKAELLEVVRFLAEPERYRRVGARVPKGVLLVGPPGTGKTLLAKAVAGESGVPFFSMSGSEFVEMFVGVGASRVRDLFEQAKERAPCIVFIDELDAIGKTRSGATGFVSNEEREQTLNQLLVEMDGFDSGGGLVIMAATNRPEVLDKALLRAGRFDRQVVVDRPDVRGRTAILEVHARKVKLGADVELSVVAQRTPGMVGADLANVVNEAALASVRRGAEAIEMNDFEEAIDRLQLGLKKDKVVMSELEKRRVAFHEAGHAIVALSVAHADPVHRVTIIPRSVGALGATLQLPTEDRYLVTREELRDRLAVLYGGRSAEEVVFGDVSTGAENDLEQATRLARHMICRFGMSDALGAQTFGSGSSLAFLSGAEGGERMHSDATAQRIDAEVTVLLEAAHARARALLADRRHALEAVARELLTRETLERNELEALVGTRDVAHKNGNGNGNGKDDKPVVVVTPPPPSAPPEATPSSPGGVA